MTAAAYFAGMNAHGTTGTRLASVSDASPAAGKAFGFKPGTGTFGYDANGNLSTDPYKGITTPITYNYLNLPQTINYSGGKSLTMVYDATGTKLRTTAAGPLPVDNYIHDYAGGIEYRKGLLEAIYHEEGRVTPKSGGGWQYEYAIRDHLGNTRLTFADLNGDNKIDVTNTSSNEVLQENHYYPFGLAQNYSWMNAAGAEDVRYKFNGKELNEELGLMDYGARWYDGALGRWNGVDPLAENYVPHSPYNYVLGNPLKYVDPNGAEVVLSTALSKDERKQIKQQLREIRRASDTFNELFKELKRDKNHVHTITTTSEGSNTKITDGSGTDNSLPTKGGNSTLVSINLSETIVEGEEVGNNIILAHELAHSYRSNEGLEETQPIISEGTSLLEKFRSTVLYSGRLKEQSEEGASHIENMVRSELGIPLREKYSGISTSRLNFLTGEVERQTLDVATIRPNFNYQQKRSVSEIKKALNN